MIDHSDLPVFVTGAARSGTSMTTGCLAACGAWVGDVIGPTPQNAKGFYENRAIRDGVVKRILADLGCDPRGQTKLPRLEDVHEVPSLRGDILRILEKQGYDGSRPWAFKDAKLSLLWPAFAAAFPAATWVLVRRDPAAIVASCERTFFMSGRTDWMPWVEEYRTRLDELGFAHALSCVDVDADALVGGDLGQIEAVCAEARLTFDAEAVSDFLEPALWTK